MLLLCFDTHLIAIVIVIVVAIAGLGVVRITFVNDVLNQVFHNDVLVLGSKLSSRYYLAG